MKLLAIVVNKKIPNLLSESAEHIIRKIPENNEVIAPPTIVYPI